MILLVGGNMAETMPPIMRYFEAQQRNGGALIVADPRRSPTAQWAKLHLALRPGSDAALANGLVHLLIRESLIDSTYIESRTEGFDDLRRLAAAYWPERVEGLTGIPQAQLVETARMLGRARTAMVLTSRGAEQQSHGVDNVLAFINVALALGKVGQPFSGYGTLTGQGNGQGGREHGQKADQLPGYRRIDDPAARRDLAAVWGIDERDLPGPGKSAYELIESAGEADGVRALLVVGSNPIVSAPNATKVSGCFKRLDFLAVADFFLSETAKIADVVLPSAQWAEEDGTVTNLEGRVIRRRRAIEPPGQVRTDTDALCALARALGKGRVLLLRKSTGGVRGTARRDPRRRRRLLGHFLRPHRAGRGSVLAMPVRRPPGNSASLSGDISDSHRAALAFMRSSTRVRPRPSMSSFPSISPPAACSLTISRERRRGGFRN